MIVLQMQPIPAPQNIPIWAWLLAVMFFMGGPILTAYIINVVRTRAEGQTAIAQSQVEANKTAKDKQLEALNNSLKGALEELAALDVAFQEEQTAHQESRERNVELSNRLTIVKVSFRMVLTAYTNFFKDDPDQLLILKDFESILQEDDKTD